MSTPPQPYRLAQHLATIKLEACADCQRVYPGTLLLPRRHGRICETCLDLRYDMGLDQ